MLSLLTQNVYFRDAAYELWKNNSNINDFEWLKHLRFYIVESSIVAK